MMRFNYSISHVPGRYFYTADALSCDPVSTSKQCFQKEVDSYVSLVVNSLLATDSRPKQIHSQQEENYS